jgi:nitrite reductase/ring-hydroxylating ferredoxin subunit
MTEKFEPIPVCERNTLVRGEVHIVRLPRTGPRGEPREGFVLLDASGTPRAYLNRCQHLPIPLDAGTGELLTEDGEHILCSTHGALYRLEDGYCLRGPCDGRWLEPLAIRIEHGVVYLIEDPD